jgi:hypothetical protein
MAGSILEAILADLLLNPANNRRALSAAAAPKKKTRSANLPGYTISKRPAW